MRTTVYLRPSVLDEARRAVVALGGYPLRLTLTGLLESALLEKLAQLQKEHHRGTPWPPLAAPLVGGRPVKNP